MPPVELRIVHPGPAAVESGVLQLPLFNLQRGGRLEDVRVAWRLAGAVDAPVVAALGGISAHRRVCDVADPRDAWWSAIAGPDLPLDTSRFRVLGIDWLGGSGESTGAQGTWDGVTPLDVRDQARALVAVCDHLGIARLHAVAGASYGGMVGFALAELAPARVRHLLAISAAHRSNALSTAWRAIQREIVRQALHRGDGVGGLRIARALAMTTYRTRADLNSRFPVDVPSNGRTDFAVEDYLFARGEDYARRHTPESFLCLSESIDLHRVDPGKIRVPVTLVAICEDQLVPIEDMRELAASLAGPCRLIEIHSNYGHDAFLKERELLAPAFAAALDGDRP
ncbi:MAG: homoserine O-succinyltransferase MetX [Steroidobacteraceae bacterium]